MKLTGIKRIIKEDFPPEIQKWIDTLLYPLNQNIEQTKEALTQNLNIEDNLLATVKTLTLDGTSVITANSTAGSAVLTNPVYYNATIANPTLGGQETYGVQVGQKIDGVGITEGTTIAKVGATITLSSPVQYTQTNGEFVAGGKFPFKFTHGLTVRPTIVLVAKIVDTVALKAPLARGVFVHWDLEGDNIVIKALTGLQAGKRYNVSFLIF